MQKKKLLGAKTRTDYYRGLIAFYTASVYFDKNPNKAKKLYNGSRKIASERRSNQKLKSGSLSRLLQREDKANEYVEILLDKVIPLAA